MHAGMHGSVLGSVLVFDDRFVYVNIVTFLYILMSFFAGFFLSFYFYEMYVSMAHLRKSALNPQNYCYCGLFQFIIMIITVQ